MCCRYTGFFIISLDVFLPKRPVLLSSVKVQFIGCFHQGYLSITWADDKLNLNFSRGNVNVQAYLLKRQQMANTAPVYRELCMQCTQPQFSCYCSEIQTLDAKISFVILIHPIEVKRRIATGRMSHLCLQNSFLIKGQDYSKNKVVNELLAEPEYHSVILYPGINSSNLSKMTELQKKTIVPSEKKLRIFVIDGTWATARRMIRQSTNLNMLPRICFTPTKPSNFRVRKQPRVDCYSTIEAIHETIELLGTSQDFCVSERRHDNLLKVFDSMVERQLEFIRVSNANPRVATYRREGQKKSA